MAFRADVVEQQPDSTVRRSLTSLELEDLHPGDVTIRVEWSSVNYKDALATMPNGGGARASPLGPGVDLAGTVVEGADPDIAPGDAVIAHAYDLGVSHHGGFAELARVPAAWVVPLPDGLTARDSMAI